MTTRGGRLLGPRNQASPRAVITKPREGSGSQSHPRARPETTGLGLAGGLGMLLTALPSRWGPARAQPLAVPAEPLRVSRPAPWHSDAPDAGLQLQIRAQVSGLPPVPARAEPLGVGAQAEPPSPPRMWVLARGPVAFVSGHLTPGSWVVAAPAGRRRGCSPAPGTARVPAACPGTCKPGGRMY